jgi:hypothetical protein
VSREIKQAQHEIDHNHNRLSALYRVLMFVVVSSIAFIVVTFLHYLVLFYKAFYNAMFLLRGLTSMVEMPSFMTTAKNVLMDLGRQLSISPQLIEIIFYPAFVMIRFFGSFSMNLDKISVKCEGSKAPAELFINFGVLGIVVSIVMSGYQYLWLIVFPNLNQSFLKKNILIKTKERFAWINLLSCFIGEIVMSVNPFEAIVRFLMTTVTLGRFFENNGGHRITPACDTIEGMENLDSALGISSTIVAWWLIMPLTYILSEILVPRCILRDKEIIRLPHEDNLLAMGDQSGTTKMKKRKYVNFGQRKSPRLFNYSVSPGEKFKNEGIEMNSPNTLTASYNGDHQRHHRKAFHSLSTSNIEKAQQRTKQNSIYNVLARYRRKCFKGLQTLISIDIIIISLATHWLTFLGRRHDVNAMKKLHNDSSDEESDEEDDVAVQNDRKQRRQERDRRTILQKIWASITLEKSSRLHEKNVKWLRYAKEDESRTRAIILSSYGELCVLVSAELVKRRLWSKWFARLMSWLGPGHAFTRVGKMHWKLVMRKYYCFLCGCLGIWTDEIEKAFAFDEITSSLYLSRKDESDCCEDHDTYRTLLYINIGVRSIVLQMVPALTLLSVVVSTLSSTPLFVQSQRLSSKLPPLLIWNAWELSEEVYIAANDIPSSDNLHWMLWLGSICIFMTRSRLLAFISNFLALMIPFLAINFTEESMAMLVFILFILFPFVCAKTLSTIILIGRQLHITDSDLRYLGKILLWLLSLGRYQTTSNPAKIHSNPIAIPLEEQKEDCDDDDEMSYVSVEFASLSEESGEGNKSSSYSEEVTQSSSHDDENSGEANKVFQMEDDDETDDEYTEDGIEKETDTEIEHIAVFRDDDDSQIYGGYQNSHFNRWFEDDDDSDEFYHTSETSPVSKDINIKDQTYFGRSLLNVLDEENLCEYIRRESDLDLFEIAVFNDADDDD